MISNKRSVAVWLTVLLLGFGLFAPIPSPARADTERPAEAEVGAEADERDGRHAHDHEHDDHGETETIVVTASPLEHDRDELSIPVDRVSRDELLDNLGSTLGESLSHIPGLSSTGFTAGASRPVIRGQDA